MIEDWETALADLDVPGAKGIARDLAALRKQLEKSEPDGERVQALLHRLGTATVKIADRAEKNGDKAAKESRPRLKHETSSSVDGMAIRSFPALSLGPSRPRPDAAVLPPCLTLMPSYSSPPAPLISGAALSMARRAPKLPPSLAENAIPPPPRQAPDLELKISSTAAARKTDQASVGSSPTPRTPFFGTICRVT
jgi:hypothetical protein